MTTFLQLFIGVLILAGLPILILAAIRTLRAQRPGCSGNHDCVTYKGEKIRCPACELREQQNAQMGSQPLSNSHCTTPTETPDPEFNIDISG